uniref:Uncharacterized protein n=1 Tax=Setaria viridis TaxID=4556 RepID=A0A4U6SQQ6_SETVI|nr:hypothetical protein SEVIR_9G033350v2 [Setaria viridis]
MTASIRLRRCNRSASPLSCSGDESRATAGASFPSAVESPAEAFRMSPCAGAWRPTSGASPRGSPSVRSPPASVLASPPATGMPTPLLKPEVIWPDGPVTAASSRPHLGSPALSAPTTPRASPSGRAQGQRRRVHVRLQRR